ncbi:MAG: UvrD-helicase domain-containing protein [Ruminococcus callidus]
MTEAECIALKQQAFRKYFHSLNEQQQQAVFSVNGPVLVLAGAGSGKTTAIISRIVNMIYFGDGYAQADATCRKKMPSGCKPTLTERTGRRGTPAEILAIAPIRPWNILAITFTNKAAEKCGHVWQAPWERNWHLPCMPPRSTLPVYRSCGEASNGWDTAVTLPFMMRTIPES